uniref:Putative deoxyribonuclease ii n=1 Tax=Ixodes ricinus TaxID=34613 RepID=A0A0K8RLQ7_IXORI
MWRSIRIIIAVLTLLETVNSDSVKHKHHVHCKNHQNQNVDWFVVYKLPKMNKIKYTDSYYVTPDGEEIAYFDSTMTQGHSPRWKQPHQSIYSQYNPVAYTLSPLFQRSKPTDIAYVIYNDQVPEGFSGTKGGHSKGILMVGKRTTVWLQHSVPRFPKRLHRRYEYPTSGRENAQLFLCITVPTENTAEVIAYHLRLQYANVYQRHRVTWMKAPRFPNFYMLLRGKYVKGKESLANDTMYSVSGKQPVQYIAKRSTWQHDIYSDFVAPYVLRDNLVVETWRNGAGGAVDRLCRKYSVLDVKQVKIVFDTQKYCKFLYTEDHSKWAVSVYKEYFCFSSLNRMKSQFNRGGEVTCLENRNLAKLFRDSIAEKYPCTGYPGKKSFSKCCYHSIPRP